MYDIRPNLEPGNPDGHTVLRYLVETKQMPLETAIERVYQAVARYAQEFRSDQNKLLTGMVATGVLGLPIFFPFGIPSLLIVGAVGASVVRWQELGTMRERLKPEYAALKGSVLLEQFIKWLAQELKERRGQATNSGEFQPDAIATANILSAYEHTVEAVTNGEHLENNASDPILALFILKLRQHTNHLPDWVLIAFRQLEQAEVQRASDVERASRYMWGNLEQRYPERFNQPPTGGVGQNTRLNAVDVPAQPVQGEGEQRLGKLIEPAVESTLPANPIGQTLDQPSTQISPVDVALEMAKVPKSTIIAAAPRVGKGVVVTMAIAHLKQLHPDLEIWLIDPKDEPTERHYWALIDLDKRCHFDLRPYDVDTDQVIEVFTEHLIRFNASPSPRKLLIIDEFVTFNQKCAGTFMRRLKDFIVGICSSGEVSPDMGIGRFVWVVTQSPYVSDIGFKTKAALATFQRVFLLNSASVQLYSLAVSASFVPDGFEKKINYLLKATGRVFYYSRTDAWHPIPKYELPDYNGDTLLRSRLEGLLAASDEPDTVDTTDMPLDTPSDTPDTPPDTPETSVDRAIDDDVDPTDTYLDTPDTDTYQAENFAKDFSEWTEQEMLIRIRDTRLPPGRFIKEELKITNGEKNKLARKAIGYLVRKYGDFRLMEKFKDYL